MKKVAVVVILLCVVLCGCDKICRCKECDKLELWSEGYTAGVASGVDCVTKSTGIFIEGGMTASSKRRAVSSIEGCVAAKLLEAMSKANLD